MSVQLRRAISCAILIATACVCGYGQTQTTGSIGGVVQDQTAALIPGVEVTAEQTGTGFKRSATTNEAGVYMLSLLPIGQYNVRFSLSGFRTVMNRGITVNATEKITLNGKLQVADVDTTVDVSATAQLLQTETTTLGRVIDEHLTTTLPLPTKNYTQLLGLSTGTAAGLSDTATLGPGSINISANGAPTNANAFLLDGVDANNIHTNGAANNRFASNGVPIPSTEVIQEFKVQSGQYDAQYGRNAGAHINAVTKSGTNVLHGVVYEYFRNDVLNANNFFFNKTGTPRPVLRQNQYGATIGGPIRRDKTFFFLGFQGTRQINGASTAFSTAALVLPPIPAARTRENLGQIFGGQAGINGGVAVARDGSNINPVAMALLNARLPDGSLVIPTPLTSGPGVNYTASIPGRYDEDQATVNLDHEFAPNHKAALRLFGANVPRTVPFDSLNPPGWPVYQDLKNRNISITYTYTISPRTVNEARAGYNRPAGRSNLTNPVSAEQIGMNRFNRDKIPYIPQITVAGAFTLGYNPNVDELNIPNIFTYQDTLSLTLKSHFMRMGGEARRHSTNYFLNWGFQGLMTFQSFPDFLLGMPGGPSGNGTAFSNIFSTTVTAGQTGRNFRATDLAGFFQDDWKASPNLTLNLGVRWEYLGPIYDKYGRSGNFDPRLYKAPPPGGQTTSGFVLPDNTDFQVPGLPLVDKTFLDHTQKKLFSPRIGLAYRPIAGKSLVLRAGYGFFYDRVSNNLILQTITSPPFFTLLANSGSTISYASFQNPFPDLPPNSAHPLVPVIYSPPNNAERRLVSVYSLNPLLKTPYLQQYSLNLQHELTRSLLLEVGYAGSKGTNLRNTRTINQVLLASPEHPVNGVTTNTVSNVSERVPYVGFSPTGLTQVQTETDSRYHSLQVSLTQRLSSGLQFLSSYTWEKSLDNSGGSGDQTDKRQNRGLSSFDRQHRFVFSYVYDFPAWGFGLNDTKFGRRFFPGWQLSGIATLQSGGPLSITDSGGARLYGSSQSRASYAPGATSKTATLSGDVTQRLSRYFDSSAFARAGDYFGNTGVGILRGPGQSNIDVSLSKKIAIHEKKAVEFRTEVFNAFNTTNFANPNTGITSSAFGTISGTVANSRLIQFGLRILY